MLDEARMRESALKRSVDKLQGQVRAAEERLKALADSDAASNKKYVDAKTKLEEDQRVFKLEKLAFEVSARAPCASGPRSLLRRPTASSSGVRGY